MDQNLCSTSTCGLHPGAQSPAVIIGLYGIPGTGKSFLLQLVQQAMGEERFNYYEGSEAIASLFPGGLDEFKQLEEGEKTHWRKIAIERIETESATSRKTAIVTGHFMFWSEGEHTGQAVCTESDLKVYTHIIYVDEPAELVAQRRQLDGKRSRPKCSVSHLHGWQTAEKNQLRQLCRENGILFSLVSSSCVTKLLALVRDFQKHNEGYNLSLAAQKLDEALLHNRPHPFETVLVLDADKTLAADDTGLLFWKRTTRQEDEQCPLATIFKSSLGYSYAAFRQATLLYEETTDDEAFDQLCSDVASAVTLYPEFLSLLSQVATQDHVGAVVVTCGPRQIWEKVLQQHDISPKVAVVGGGRISDDFVVTPAVKAALVHRLQHIHQVYVWAFGDSPLDLPMLHQADKAVVVVGDVRTRSRSMDAALMRAVDNDGLQACQLLVPGDVLPRGDVTKLPVVCLTDQHIMGSILSRIHLIHATDTPAAKLLMTPMRDARIKGPALREAHHHVGWLLAMIYVSEIIGLAPFHIPHVQGHTADGFHLLDESRTLIVSLMRGGEAMAFGINAAFPDAMFLHANRPENITSQCLSDRVTVILVDSVINSGKSILQFAEHIRKLHATVRIVVVAGAVQAQSMSARSPVRAFARTSELAVVALRLSENKFSGVGTTDTGNRLYNTVHLP